MTNARLITVIAGAVVVSAFLASGLTVFVLAGMSRTTDVSEVGATETEAEKDGGAGRPVETEDLSVLQVSLEDDQPLAPPRSKSSAPPIVVSVSGHVFSPGMYRLRAGERVHHLLEEADGLKDGADLRDINLAATLRDGTTLHVPALPAQRHTEDARSLVLRGNTPERLRNPAVYTRSGWRPQSGIQSNPTSHAAPSVRYNTNSDSSSPEDDRLELNAATRAELEELPGIGPVTAGKIIRHREASPFRRVEDLMQVPGIGPKKREAVQDLVTVR
jgi:competence protein ComEA